MRLLPPSYKLCKVELACVDFCRNTIYRSFFVSGHSNKLAGQIGEYLVCAELGRRGLIATPFSGNVPSFDVLAADEQCRAVPIQVKASRGDSWPSDARSWMNLELDSHTGVQHYNGLATITNPDLIYVCVVIAKPGEQDRFFILTKADIQHVCVKVYSEWMEPKGWKRPRTITSFDCRYNISNIAEFEDNWQLIVQRLEATSPNQALPDARTDTPTQI